MGGFATRDGSRSLVARATERFVTRAPGLDTRHCFSFGEHYDPANVGFGDLVALNDDCLAPEAGYPPHRHAGLDLVSWVVSGGLRHEHEGAVSLVRPGGAQLLATGPGVEHSEANAGGDCLRFVQVWLRADDGSSGDAATGVRYESVQADFRPAQWVPIAGGSERPAPMRLTSPQAAVFVTRLQPGESPDWPVTAWAHLFVVQGLVRVAGLADLAVGDSLRATSTTGLTVSALQPSELLLVSAPADQASPIPRPGSAALTSVSR